MASRKPKSGHNRMTKLERDGAIVGYTLRLRPDAEAHRIRAIMSIEIDGNHEDAAHRVLRGHPNVVALHTTNGRWDLMAELRADTLEAFEKVLNAIRSIKASRTPRRASCCPRTSCSKPPRFVRPIHHFAASIAAN